VTVSADEAVDISLRVNGTKHTLRDLPARTSLADLLREHLGLTGTHLGCEHGVCGACTVQLDGQPVRSCIQLAATCEGADVVTVEGLEGSAVDILRESFSAEHGLQCGFCTSGMLVSCLDILDRFPQVDEDVARRELSGNLCRCTGYAGIVRAVVRAGTQLAGGGGT
jgi:aerobic carbon-monoxide dehydrogenase small subunit